MDGDMTGQGTCSNCTQCQRETRCRGGRNSNRGQTSSTRRRERRRRRAAGSNGRHRSRSNRRGGSNSRASSSRHGSRRTSPTRGGESRRSSPRRGRSAVSPEEEARRSQTAVWPHSLSFLLATISTLLGMFSISRFAVLTIDFGAVFLLQFILLTVCFGVPMLTLYTCMGQYLGSGLIDMWRISPVFQGVGVSLMLVQGMVGVYSMVITSWMFVYFRDSFISVYEYKWSQCQDIRQCGGRHENLSWPLSETIPDYFASTVLHRTSRDYPEPAIGHPKFQISFHLIVIWMVVFICLSKGLRSYGKVVYIFATVPIVGFVAFSVKILGDFPLHEFQSWLHHQSWSGFIYNAKSWVCAAKECFLVWSLLGGSLLQLGAHNKFNNKIKRDTVLAVLVVILFLIMSGLVGVAVNRKIEIHGKFSYTPSSFETSHSYSFLEPLERTRYPASGDHLPSPSRPPLDTIDHVSFFAGIRILDPTRPIQKFSGYQVHRLATELIPTYLTVLGPHRISPIWSVLFYFTIIMLGISQCLPLFHTVIQGLISIKPSSMKNWEGSITFCVCCVGLVLGLPMATEIGIYVVYFLDYTLGCGWWTMVLYLLLIFAVMVVRGKPYGPDQISTLLFPKSACCSSWLGPMVAFTWSVVLPISLLIMSVVSFKTGYISEMFDWDLDSGYVYLPSWVREIGSMMQLMPILIVPFVGIIQSCRYFLNDSETLFYRLELLYRPSYPANRRPPPSRSQEVVLTNFSHGTSTPTPPPANDPPPKYTPPPSYSTATGARLARMIRQSFRRSMRRLQGTRVPSKDAQPPPPDYATVIIESDRGAGAGGQPSLPPENIYMDPSDALTVELTVNPAQSNLNLEQGPLQLQRRSDTSDLQIGNLLKYIDPGSVDQSSGPASDSQPARDTGQRRPAVVADPVNRLARHHSLRNYGLARQVLGGGGGGGRGGGGGGGDVLALGVGHLQRVDSQAVLVESAEPIYFDSGSELYSGASSMINHSRQMSYPLTEPAYSLTRENRFEFPTAHRPNAPQLTESQSILHPLRASSTAPAPDAHPQPVLKTVEAAETASSARESSDFFQISAPEDDFGEIVFVEMEGERVPDIQEEAVNLNVISRGSLTRSSREGITINIDTSDSVI